MSPQQVLNDFLVVATVQTKAPLQIYVSSLSLILESEGFKAVIKFQSPLSLLHWLSPSLWEAEKPGLPPVVVCLKDPEFSGNPSYYDRIHTCGAEREKKGPLLIHRRLTGGTSGLVGQLRHVCVLYPHHRLSMWTGGLEHSHVKVSDCHSNTLLFHAYDSACAVLGCPYEQLHHCTYQCFPLPDGHPLPAHRLLAAARNRANKLESAAAAGCQLGLPTAIWGARLSKPSPAGTSGRGRMSSAPLIQSDSDGQVQRGEMMAKVFLLSGQCLKRWTWRSQGFKVQLCVCALLWACVLVCPRLLLGACVWMPVPECWRGFAWMSNGQAEH